MTLGEQIRQAREKKNLSQEELADRLHVSRQAISKWENNNSVPQGINRELLTQVLDFAFTQNTEQPPVTPVRNTVVINEESTKDKDVLARRKSFVLFCFLAASALIILIITLMPLTKESDSFQCIRFYDYQMKEIAETSRYNISKTACILIQWNGKSPDNIKVFSSPNASATQSETQLLLTQQISSKDDHVILLSSESIRGIEQGFILFGLDYGDHIALSDVYEFFCDKEQTGDSWQITQEEKNLSNIVIRNKLDIINDITELIGGAESARYELENFQLDILVGSGQITQDKQKRLDCVFQADWISVRKPEDDPMIQGMYQAMEELTDEDEIAYAQDVIDGWIVEMNSWPEKERLGTDLALLFDETDCWSIYYIYIMDGVEELIPLEEYAETEMTENTEERRQNGINTIYQEIEWLREKKASE